MKLKNIEVWRARGFKMTRLVESAEYGLFYSKDARYEERVIHDFDKALRMNTDEGWFFTNYDCLFADLSIAIMLDLLAENKPTVSAVGSLASEEAVE